MGLEQQISAAALRDARDASSAHLEAVLKVNGASYLRLAHLRDLLGSRDSLDLKSAVGAEPQLWLDLAHCVTMEPDAKTYRLSHHGTHRIDVLLETENLDAVLDAVRNVQAHQVVAVARQSRDEAQKAEWRWMTLLYVWMTGVVTGIAVLALYVITMKKLPF